MTRTKICLASDNSSGVHPSIMQALLSANEGYALGYGADPWTENAQKLIQETFQTKGKVFIVPTGTGSNIFALKLACKRHESVICTDISHIAYHETGSAEAVVGCKLLSVPHQQGKLTPEIVLKKIKRERACGKHATSPRVLTIAQPTEVGTLYTLEELAALSKLCKEEKLLFHIDGSRLYNAAVALQVSLHEMLKISEADILSLGGTKNGLMGAEALIICNPALEEGSDHIQKQSLQLMSKSRYLAAQFIAFFKDDLWRTLAQHANEKAKELEKIVRATPNCSLSYPVETNQLFFTVPTEWISLIQEEIACILWDHEKNEMRFVASWNTSENDVEAIKQILSKISNIDNAVKVSTT